MRGSEGRGSAAAMLDTKSRSFFIWQSELKVEGGLNNWSRASFSRRVSADSPTKLLMAPKGQALCCVGSLAGPLCYTPADVGLP